MSHTKLTLILSRWTVPLGMGLCIVGALALIPTSVSAGTVYLESDSTLFLPEHQIAVDVKINTLGVEVNAIKAAIAFPDDQLEFVEAYERGSMITTWIDSPKVSGNTVIFSGIMAGGYSGTISPITGEKYDGTILRIIFKTLGEGSGVITIPDIEVYENDGRGTLLTTTVKGLPFVISEITGMSQEFIEDLYPPESFVPEIIANEFIYDGKYTLIFNTHDKETGVAYYEVKEGGRAWERTESPYLLRDQSLRTVIWVKAVDYAGNVRKEQLHGTALVPIIILLGVVLAVVIALIFTMRWIRQRVQ